MTETPEQQRIRLAAECRRTAVDLERVSRLLSDCWQAVPQGCEELRHALALARHHAVEDARRYRGARP